MMRQGRSTSTTFYELRSTNSSRGATLLDAIVGTALMLVVFVGIVGAFRLTIMVVSNNKARAGAIALANERLEFIRSLPYDSVGTSGGIPAGEIAQSETVTLNDVAYTRRTFIAYEDDPADGLGGTDTNAIVTDFKAAKVTVSWTVRDGEHTITLVTRVSPPGIETLVPGGTLAINVTDATLAPVSSAQIRIVNLGVTPAIDMTTLTDTMGLASVLGVPPGSGYEIIVTKSGYSTARTYSSNATNTNPIPAHLGVALNQTTAATFAIDVLSTKIIETYTPVTQGTTTESFVNADAIASSTDVVIDNGAAQIIQLADGFPASGMFISDAIATTSLAAWDTFYFEDTTPSGTSIVYRMYTADGTAPLSDAQLPGNSSGFSSSPIDLRSVSTSTHPGVRVHATLTTSDASTTPTIESYALSFFSGPRPRADVAFSLTGAKTIGTTVGGTQVYKYQNSTLNTGASGSLTLPNMEWDTYTVALTGNEYVVSSACDPQPDVLAPNSTDTTRLYLSPATTNSLLVDVQSATGTIANASVRLTRGAYDVSVSTDGCGNAFFSNLSVGTPGGGNPYTIEVTSPGFQNYTSSEVSVSGVTRLSILLNN